MQNNILRFTFKTKKGHFAGYWRVNDSGKTEYSFDCKHWNTDIWIAFSESKEHTKIDLELMG